MHKRKPSFTTGHPGPRQLLNPKLGPAILDKDDERDIGYGTGRCSHSFAASLARGSSDLVRLDYVEITGREGLLLRTYNNFRAERQARPAI
ncbi:hypothetical protein G6F57_022179 [Rhizopus arrhizus]|nr:hypothetical protein G6F57_022179 [Rhizopus arrhizus]